MPGYEDPIWKEYLKQFKAAEDLLMQALKIEPEREPSDPPFNEQSGSDHLRHICEEARKLK